MAEYDRSGNQFDDDTRSFAPALIETRFTVPGHCLLEGFTALSAASSGVDMQSLCESDVIRLRTLNSEYRMVLLDPAAHRVSVQGGSFFPEPTEAVVRGSSCGGALVKVGWIGIGLQLEFTYHPARGRAESVITSPVEKFSLERA